MKVTDWLRIGKSTLIFFGTKLPMVISAYIVVPITVALISKSAERLPSWLAWYDNGDEFDRKYGLIGDIPNQRRNMEKGINPNSYRAKVGWLLRNPVNYFQYRVLGFSTDNGDNFESYNLHSKPDILGAEVGDYTSGGFRKILLKLDGKLRYEYYWVIPYKSKPGRCFRARIGWKITDLDNIIGKDKRKVIQFSWAVHPYHGFSGKS